MMIQTTTLPGLPDLTPGSIYCIGRNYAAHTRELNNSIPDTPVIFTKPLAALTFDGIIHIPPFVTKPHFETELVVVIGKQGKNVPVEKALSYVAGYGLGIDVTARDIQQRLKEKAHPWFLAKGMDSFAPVGTFIPAEQVSDPQNMTFTLDVNGERRQTGQTSLMLFPIPVIIATLSRYVTLYPGDLIFTGTPEGVDILNSGDRLKADLESGLATLTVSVNRES